MQTSGDLGAEEPDVLAGIIIITRPDPQRHMSHMIATVVPGSLVFALETFLGFVESAKNLCRPTVGKKRFGSVGTDLCSLNLRALPFLVRRLGLSCAGSSHS